MPVDHFQCHLDIHGLNEGPGKSGALLLGSFRMREEEKGEEQGQVVTRA